jgi:hypothetical protein
VEQAVLLQIKYVEHILSIILLISVDHIYITKKNYGPAVNNKELRYGGSNVCDFGSLLRVPIVKPFPRNIDKI